jgi:hypothetical protein
MAVVATGRAKGWTAVTDCVAKVAFAIVNGALAILAFVFAALVLGFLSSVMTFSWLIS